MYDFSNPNDVAEIRKLLEDDASDDPALVEDFGKESDIDSLDEVEQCDEDSETEPEDEGTSEKVEDDFFLGKDKQTKWTKKASPASFRQVQGHNIITHLPGVKGDARNAKTVLQCWECLSTTEILELIVKYTNQYIDSVKSKFARERDAKETDIIEIKAFIGLLYLAGAYRGNRHSLEEL
ncbi:uncharacterized protein LOC112127235 [Cimex lectularius]|uniref:PiggyBac transposable element-derived protein domain-containing protein n=1 Tax=Cimex lectularius TaxID=79782 RepID=A0A8I6SJJ5_CIMLE|nr:uncharacterized protein LOC112127235 [Cimex lectularius]